MITLLHLPLVSVVIKLSNNAARKTSQGRTADPNHGHEGPGGAYEQEYCICRSKDSTRFMIGCDNCEEWYHGDCIGVTQKDAEQIKHFYCASCREQDQSLEIKYKHKKSSSKEKHSSHKHSSDREFRSRDDSSNKKKSSSDAVSVQLVTGQRIVQDATTAKI